MGHRNTPAYKIVLDEDGKFRTLYHGVDGDRTLPSFEWLRAERKMRRDGGGQDPYETGFHVFNSRPEAVAYLDHFRTDAPRRVVLCLARDLRPKPTNDHVPLADEIKIMEEPND